MLNLAKKTPTRIDDFLVLILGLVLVIVPILKIAGWLPIPFEYLDVFFGMVVPVALGVFYWSQSVYTWLKYRDAGEQFNPPDVKVMLLMVLGLYHAIPIYRVTVVGENTMISATWLAFMIFATTAVVTGKYLWFFEFFSLMWGGGEAVAIRATSLNKAAPQNAPEWLEEDGGDSMGLDSEEAIVTPPAFVPLQPSVPKPPVFSPPIQDWANTRQSYQPIDETSFVTPVGNPNTDFVPEFGLMSPAELLQMAVDGDDAALDEVIVRLGYLNRENLTEILKVGRVPDMVINTKVLPALDGDKRKLREVFTHPAFERQRQAFLNALMG